MVNETSGNYTYLLDLTNSDLTTSENDTYSLVNVSSSEVLDTENLTLDTSVVPLLQWNTTPAASTQSTLLEDMWLNITNLTLTTQTPVLQADLAHHPALAVLLTMFVFVTIFGNCLVIVAVAKQSYLRSATNHMIVSLAIADLLVGTIVMPFSIVQTMFGGYWPFGLDWCDLWHSFDVLSATASILNLCVIALDRYWAITDPIAYPTKMSSKRVWILISLVWVCSCAISFPAILWWRADQPEDYPLNECLFTENASYLIISSIVSFYAPLFIMLFVYYRIYRAATARNRSLKTGGKIVLSDGLRGEVMTLRIHRGRANPSLLRNGHDQYQRAPFTDTETETGSAMTHTDSDDQDHRPHTRFIKRRIQKFAIGRKLSRLAKEQKAAKTLGIVIGVFVCCWVPFFLSNVLIGICNTHCVHNADILMPIFTWLGYLNSGMNPIIYALSMRDFRRAFRSILCAYCPKIKTIKQPPKRTYQRSMSTTSFSAMTAVGPNTSHHERPCSHKL